MLAGFLLGALSKWQTLALLALPTPLHRFIKTQMNVSISFQKLTHSNSLVTEVWWRFTQRLV
jgi:hypothetical protein